MDGTQGAVDGPVEQELLDRLVERGLQRSSQFWADTWSIAQTLVAAVLDGSARGLET